MAELRRGLERVARTERSVRNLGGPTGSWKQVGEADREGQANRWRWGMSNPPDKPIIKRAAFWGAVGLLLLSAVGVVVLVVVSSERTLSSLEGTLLQVLILSASLAGSFIHGRQSAQLAARELVKPAARSAFRRVLGLYASLGRLAETVQRLRSDAGGTHDRLDIVEALITEQQASVNDAMEDWRDLVPDDVADVERRLRDRTAQDGEGS